DAYAGRRPTGDRRAKQASAHRTSWQATTQNGTYPQGTRDRASGRHRASADGAFDVESQYDALYRQPVGRRSAVGRLAAFFRRCAAAAVRRISLSQLALVLGFWRWYLHRFDGSLDRRRTLDLGDRSSTNRGQHWRLSPC